MVGSCMLSRARGSLSATPKDLPFGPVDMVTAATAGTPSDEPSDRGEAGDSMMVVLPACRGGRLATGWPARCRCVKQTFSPGSLGYSTFSAYPIKSSQDSGGKRM